MVQYGGVAHYNRVHFSVVHCTAKYSTGAYGTVRYGTVWYGTVRYGTVWYGTVRYSTWYRIAPKWSEVEGLTAFRLSFRSKEGPGPVVEGKAPKNVPGRQPYDQ